MEVIYYKDASGKCPVKDYLRCLSSELSGKIKLLVDIEAKIQYLRFNNPCPPASPLHGHEFLEIKHRRDKNTVIRILFFIHKDKIVLLNVFEKPDNYKEQRMKKKIESYYNKTDKYLNDERNLAISITSQLLSLFPGKLRFKTNLGYMYLGESAFDRAEPLLIDVINSENVGKDEEIFAFIARCNLLYLYIIQGHFEKTATLLEILLNSDKAKEEATLRVPFWFQGEIHSDPAQFPGRDITMEMAALGCGIAAALAQDDLERAEQYYSELSSKETDNPLTLVCLGTLEIEKGNKKQAIIAWEKAIEVSNNEEEISILKNWVELLEQK